MLFNFYFADSFGISDWTADCIAFLFVDGWWHGIRRADLAEPYSRNNRSTTISFPGCRIHIHMQTEEPEVERKWNNDISKSTVLLRKHTLKLLSFINSEGKFDKKIKCWNKIQYQYVHVKKMKQNTYML